jgi:hypothetical protein
MLYVMKKLELMEKRSLILILGEKRGDMEQLLPEVILLY